MARFGSPRRLAHKFVPPDPARRQAAVSHHFEEVVQYRLAAGGLGLLVLVGWGLSAWRRRRHVTVKALPDGFVATVGAALFGVAGLGLLAMAGGLGLRGAELSAALVSLGFFAAFATAWWQTLGRRLTAD